LLGAEQPKSASVLNALRGPIFHRFLPTAAHGSALAFSSIESFLPLMVLGILGFSSNLFLFTTTEVASG